MKIGYARVSTKEQHLDMQLEALKAAGCEKIFSEKMTGRQQNRPELDACLNFLREGDTLVVYKLDRLGRSLKNILTLLEDFKNRGIQFTSLQDNISTEGAIGQLMNNILGAFAQFERDLIYERTQEGRRIAKEKGVKFG
ncbi:recombinase family protein, partial [Parabacteroides distasonis]